MRSWIRNPVIVVVAVLALTLAALPLQALPADPVEPADRSSWSVELPQALIGWVQALVGLTGPDGTAPTDDTTATTECGPVCDDGSGGDGGGDSPQFGPIFDPNG